MCWLHGFGFDVGVGWLVEFGGFGLMVFDLIWVVY